MGVNPKIGVEKTPKMDGKNNGKPHFSMDDLVGKKTYFWVATRINWPAWTKAFLWALTNLCGT